MDISPVKNTRALKISLEDSEVLVVGDLHLGISAELSRKGIELPNQIREVQRRLQRIIREEEAEQLFFLGDIKHNIPITSRQEWENLPRFFSDLGEEVEIDVVVGNHDGDIQGLIPKEVGLHGSKGTTIGGGRIGLLHGHAWPAPELMRAEEIIMGHNHPIIEFRDDLGGRVKEPAWMKTRVNVENLPEELQEEVDGEGPRVTIAPAFSKLVGGEAINKKTDEKLLGPLFNADAIEIDGSEIYLLDGTFLGKLEDLRELADSEQDKG